MSHQSWQLQFQEKGAQSSGGYFGSLRGGLAGDTGPHSPPHSPLALSPFPQRITVISPAQAPQVLGSLTPDLLALLGPVPPFPSLSTLLCPRHPGPVLGGGVDFTRSPELFLGLLKTKRSEPAEPKLSPSQVNGTLNRKQRWDFPWRSRG